MKNKAISIIILIVTMISIFNNSKATTDVKVNTEEKNKVNMQSDNIYKEKVSNEEESDNVEIVENIEIEILNLRKNTLKPLQGNVFNLLNEDHTICKQNLVTDTDGKIVIEIKKEVGKVYWLEQKSVINDYIINKALIQIKITDVDKIQIKIITDKIKRPEEVKTSVKEINVYEENKEIIENKEIEVENLNITNTNKEVTNTINETNWNNKNNFINNLNIKKTTNITKEVDYNNVIEEINNVDNKYIDMPNQDWRLEREGYTNLVNRLKSESGKIPILPVASK